MGRPPLPPDQRKPKLSGAQRRKLKAEKVAEVTQAAAALGLAVDGATTGTQDPPDYSWADEFRQAGEPDLENPDTDLFYVRKLQLMVLRQMATTPAPSPKQQDTWRRIREMSAVVGMTANRAALEAKVKGLEKKLAGVRDRTAATVEPGHAVPRSPNARGRGGPRGPRPLPGPGTGPEEGEGR